MIRAAPRPPAAQPLAQRTAPFARASRVAGVRSAAPIRHSRRETLRPYGRGGYGRGGRFRRWGQRPHHWRYGGWWDWGAPWPYWPDELPGEPIEGVAADDWPGNEPAGGLGRPEGLSDPARLGLRGGVWRGRLAAADPELRRFLSRFRGVAGIERLVEAYYGDRYQRAVARMAMRLSERLAARDRDFRRGLHYDRRISFAPDDQPILTVTATYRGINYRFFPWRRLQATALRRQLQRDRLAYGSPERVRWVFDRQLAPSAAALVGQLRGALGSAGTPALDRMVIVL